MSSSIFGKHQRSTNKQSKRSQFKKDVNGLGFTSTTKDVETKTSNHVKKQIRNFSIDSIIGQPPELYGNITHDVQTSFRRQVHSLQSRQRLQNVQSSREPFRESPLIQLHPIHPIQPFGIDLGRRQPLEQHQQRQPRHPPVRIQTEPHYQSNNVLVNLYNSATSMISSLFTSRRQENNSSTIESPIIFERRQETMSATNARRGPQPFNAHNSNYYRLVDPYNFDNDFVIEEHSNIITRLRNSPPRLERQNARLHQISLRERDTVFGISKTEMSQLIREQDQLQKHFTEFPLTSQPLNECSICLCELKNDIDSDKDNNNSDNKVCYIHCGHVFHLACICEWLSLRPTCPMCRVNIKFKLKNIERVQENAENNNNDDDIFLVPVSPNPEEDIPVEPTSSSSSDSSSDEDDEQEK